MINRLKQEFEGVKMSKLQYLIAERPKKFTQQSMADELGVTIRTIQNFETYKSLNNHYLYWGYKKLLK